MPDPTIPDYDPHREALTRSAQRVHMYRQNRPPAAEIDEREALRREWIEYWRGIVDPRFRGDFQALASSYLRLMTVTHAGVFEKRYRLAALNVADHLFTALECLTSFQVEVLDEIPLPGFNQAAADAAYDTPNYRARASAKRSRGERANPHGA